MRYLPLILSLLVWKAHAGGDLVGNGGGGLCIDGECKTITEAGFRVSTPEEPYYSLKPAVMRALKELVLKAPLAGFREEIVKKTLGSGNNFIKLDIVDPIKVEAVRKKYAELLRASGRNVSIKDVRIFAFARMVRTEAGELVPRNETYLLPDFFTLTPEQQAKILIHESNVRGPHHDHFKPALELDGYLEDLVQDPLKLYTPSFRIERWQALLLLFYSYNFYRPDLLASWLAWFQITKQTVFNVVDFCDMDWSNLWCQPNPPRIMENYEITPGFQRFLTSPFAPPIYQFASLDISGANFAQYRSDALTFCARHLTSNEAWLLYPYNFGGPDYQLTMLRCRSSGGTIQIKALLASH